MLLILLGPIPVHSIQASVATLLVLTNSVHRIVHSQKGFPRLEASLDLN